MGLLYPDQCTSALICRQLFCALHHSIYSSGRASFSLTISLFPNNFFLISYPISLSEKNDRTYEGIHITYYKAYDSFLPSSPLFFEILHISCGNSPSHYLQSAQRTDIAPSIFINKKCNTFHTLKL